MRASAARPRNSTPSPCSTVKGTCQEVKAPLFLWVSSPCSTGFPQDQEDGGRKGLGPGTYTGKLPSGPGAKAPSHTGRAPPSSTGPGESFSDEGVWNWEGAHLPGSHILLTCRFSSSFTSSLGGNRSLAWMYSRLGGPSSPCREATTPGHHLPLPSPSLGGDGEMKHRGYSSWGG